MTRWLSKDALNKLRALDLTGLDDAERQLLDRIDRQIWQLDVIRHVLGAGEDEALYDAAQRVVAERDRLEYENRKLRAKLNF